MPIWSSCTHVHAHIHRFAYIYTLRCIYTPYMYILMRNSNIYLHADTYRCTHTCIYKYRDYYIYKYIY